MFDKEGSSLVGASDEACKYENSKLFGNIGLTNDPATCSGVTSRNVSGYLAHRRLPTITTAVFPRNKSDGTQFSKFRRKRVLPNGETVGHPWLIHLAWKIESFAATANFLALDVHSYYIQYLLP